ncbi:MAG: hypothetical protein SAJ72_24400 [Jaaginema sp. PMC 1080.18]|nr:hypothetical protein [Jaaginema sp. PMC 1080.18]MEC4869157.1 hypothetical protein [Jaaginema sp. PMC 1078.18]
MGSNNVTVITLTDVEVTSFELCRQSPPERLESCQQEAKAKGKLRTEWSVNCRNLSVTFSNRYVRDLTHEIDPQSPPSRANYSSYVVYDYACGTRYSEQ